MHFNIPIILEIWERSIIREQFTLLALRLTPGLTSLLDKDKIWVH